MPWKPPSAQHCHYDYRRTDKALAEYRSADNRGITIGRLPINTKSYKNLTFLPFEIEKVVMAADVIRQVTIFLSCGFSFYLLLFFLA